MNRPVPSAYLLLRLQDVPIATGYMVLEHFGSTCGRPLPLVVRNQELASEPAKMHNLFRDVSRIILAVARIPQPKIGAFRFNENGTIALDNRPILFDMFQWENQGAPRTMGVDQTYTSTAHYVADVLSFYDGRFLAAPNAVLDAADCEGQMAIQSFFRATAAHFLSRDCRDGPFSLFLADFNAANVMVDDDWNVTGMFDLEWIVSAPIDMPRLPRWLTWDTVDSMAGQGYDSYDTMRARFMEVFRDEEQQTDTAALEAAAGGRRLSAIMDESWASKQFWFYKALMASNAMYFAVQRQLVPLFYGESELPYSAVSPMWCPDAAAVTAKKIADRAAYVAELSKLFEQRP